MNVVHGSLTTFGSICIIDGSMSVVHGSTRIVYDFVNISLGYTNFVIIEAEDTKATKT